VDGRRVLECPTHVAMPKEAVGDEETVMDYLKGPYRYLIGIYPKSHFYSVYVI